ncbi:MAG TPA: cation transporter dimerization domain-containing protein, partial [Caldilineaceae bacterium]|nr:cation transporter dimerization domain-containing protein [Caldilineaceae bacterium]
VRRRLLALPGVGDVTVHAEAERGPEEATDLYNATRLAAQQIGVTIHEWWVQSIDETLSLHLHVGVDPNLTLAVAHDLVDQLEQTLLERLPQLTTIHSHLEPANADVLPTARVSAGLHQRVVSAVDAAAEAIPHLHDPHDIHVRQVEGRLFITVEALVDGTLSLAEAHDLSTQLQEAIRARVPNVGEALVHLEPR